VPGFRRFSAQGASRDERPELDPFAGVPDERYELSASELFGRLLEPGVRLVHVEDAYITGLLVHEGAGPVKGTCCCCFSGFPVVFGQARVRCRGQGWPEATPRRGLALMPTPCASCC
jgi:hypothetical protein